VRVATPASFGRGAVIRSSKRGHRGPKLDASLREGKLSVSSPNLRGGNRGGNKPVSVNKTYGSRQKELGSDLEQEGKEVPERWRADEPTGALAIGGWGKLKGKHPVRGIRKKPW